MPDIHVRTASIFRCSTDFLTGDFGADSLDQAGFKGQVLALLTSVTQG